MDEIFSDFGTNVNMLKGSYKKLKAYYYYNKNFILMREKIANFEQNEDKMMQTFNKLAECLAHHRKKTNKEYLDNLIKRIDFYVLPKKFDFPDKDKKTIVTNITRNKNLKTVNFFIDMPIELHILDTLWTLFLGKISYEEGLLLYNVYGNTLVDNVIYDKTNLFNINFENNRLFNMYFYKYSDWRNNAFKSLEQNYEAQKDSVMISLDIKSFFIRPLVIFLKSKKFLITIIL